MRVAGLIGLLMVHAMYRDPENRPAFKGERPADGEKVFQPQWALVPPVGMQPVVSHADSEARGDPIQEQRNQEIPPAEHKQRGEGADVKEAHGNSRWPVQTVGAREAEDIRSSLGS